MSLSTTQYGYIVDPMVPFTDDKGKTIKNGFIRVFMAGTSTPVLTYRNYDGATNQEKIELDNSGRVKHNVICSKGSLYKVVVYDALHSQETPILTVDKIAVLGASINASGATIVTGLDSVTVQEENFLKATVEGTGVELALDPTEVTSEVSTTAGAVTAAPDYVVPLLDKTGTGDGKKISLANLFKFALDWISRLATTVTSFASGDFIAVSNTTNGARKMSKDTLLELTAQNALAGNVAPAFIPNSTTTKAGLPYVYNGLLYVAKVDGYRGPLDASKFSVVSFSDYVKNIESYIRKIGYFSQHTKLVSTDLESYKGSLSSSSFYYTSSERHTSVFVPKGTKAILRNTGDYNAAYAIFPSSFIDGDKGNGSSFPAGVTRQILNIGYQVDIPATEDVYIVINVVDGDGNSDEFTCILVDWNVSKINDEIETVKLGGTKTIDSDDLPICGGSLGPTAWYSYENVRHTSIRFHAKQRVTVTNSGTYNAFYALFPSTFIDGNMSNNTPYPSGVERQTLNVGDSLTFDTDKEIVLVLNVVGGNQHHDKFSISITDYSVYALIDSLEKADVLFYEKESRSLTVNSADLTDYNASLGDDSWYFDLTNGRHTSYRLSKGELLTLTNLNAVAAFYAIFPSSFIDGDKGNGAFPSGVHRLAVASGASVKIVATDDMVVVVNTVNGGGVANQWRFDIDKLGGFEGASILNSQLVKLRVATWNVGHFSNGAYWYPTIAPEDKEAKKAEYRNLVNEVNADIFLVCENDPQFCTDGTTSAEAVWKKYKYQNPGTKYAYDMDSVYANGLKVNTSHMYDYTEQYGTTHRYWNESQFVINGKIVYVASTHISQAEGYTIPQIREIIDYYSDKEYVILAGDWNASANRPSVSMQEVVAPMFINAGYSCALCDYISAIKTVSQEGIVLDNIFVKGFSLNGVNVVDTIEMSLSDHKLVYADLTMNP